MNTPSMITTLQEQWHRLLQYRKSMVELAACPPSELHRIAQDVGVGDTDLRSLGHSHSGPMELLPRRLEQLGLDPAFLKSTQSAAYRDMERVCGHCRDWRRCTRDLAKGDVQAGMDSYCLNGPTIDALSVDCFAP